MVGAVARGSVFESGRAVVGAGVLVPGAAAPGARPPAAPLAGADGSGVAVAGVVGVGVAAIVVSVVVAAGGGEPEPPASFTRAAARIPSESTDTVASTATGVFQLGAVARRVRAAAPQRRHHSCSGWSDAPHSGQVSLAGGGMVGEEGAGAVTLTPHQPAD